MYELRGEGLLAFSPLPFWLQFYEILKRWSAAPLNTSTRHIHPSQIALNTSCGCSTSAITCLISSISNHQTLLQHGIALGAPALTLQVWWRALFSVACFRGSLNVWLQLYLLCVRSELVYCWSNLDQSLGENWHLQQVCSLAVRKTGVLGRQ